MHLEVKYISRYSNICHYKQETNLVEVSPYISPPTWLSHSNVFDWLFSSGVLSWGGVGFTALLWSTDERLEEALIKNLGRVRVITF